MRSGRDVPWFQVRRLTATRRRTVHHDLLPPRRPATAALANSADPPGLHRAIRDIGRAGPHHRAMSEKSAARRGSHRNLRSGQTPPLTSAPLLVHRRLLILRCSLVILRCRLLIVHSGFPIPLGRLTMFLRPLRAPMPVEHISDPLMQLGRVHMPRRRPLLRPRACRYPFSACTVASATSSSVHPRDCRSTNWSSRSWSCSIRSAISSGRRLSAAARSSEPPP
jgi:hypothetical protein